MSLTIAHQGSIVRRVSVVFSALVVALVATTGCEKPDDLELRELRQRFLLTQPPSKQTSIEAAVEHLSTDPEVTVAGRINAGTSDPFQAGEATLVLSEIPEPGHNHDPGDCPFCKKRLENAKSCIVRFLDRDGNVIKRDAQKLLDIKKDQDVVVQGRGALLPGTDVFQIDATAIFVPPAEIKL